MSKPFVEDRHADLEAQALALDEQCPICQQPSGDMCIGQRTGEPMRATHWQRIPKPPTTKDQT